MTLIKTLPITIPPLKTYQFLAYPLSIILNYNEVLPWFYGNFIQLVYRDRVVEFGYSINADDFPWLLVEPSKDKLEKADFLEHLLFKLNEESYIYLFVDKFYLSYSAYFNKEHFSHDLLLHGFNKKTKIFHASGYDKKNQYTFFEIPFEEIFAGWYSEFNGTKLMTFLKYKRYKYDNYAIYSSKFDLIKLHDLVNKHQNSISFNNNHLTNYFAGLDVYRIMLYDLKYCTKTNSFIDVRSYQAIWEHKTLMTERLVYFSAEMELDTEDLLSLAKQVEKKALVIRNLVMKYNLTKSIQVYESLNRHLIILYDEEKKFFYCFYKVIEKWLTHENEQRQIRQQSLMLIEMSSRLISAEVFTDEYELLLNNLESLDDMHLIYHVICNIPENGLKFLIKCLPNRMESIILLYLKYIDEREWDSKEHIDWLIEKCVQISKNYQSTVVTNMIKRIHAKLSMRLPSVKEIIVNSESL